jgi:hypothetical protein
MRNLLSENHHMGHKARCLDLQLCHAAQSAKTHLKSVCSGRFAKHVPGCACRVWGDAVGTEDCALDVKKRVLRTRGVHYAAAVRATPASI